tara:strand:+ start:585 stop:1061 length:477 start_codon:yes stop_codon:yes gene_type:complete
MKLNVLNDNKGSTKQKKRLGRGTGSGIGKTCGRGHKGQKSRSGSSIKGFEGGQMPIHRRLPKRGFKNFSKKKFNILNLGILQKAIDDGKIDIKAPLDSNAFASSGLISSKNYGVKLLARGEIKTKIEVHVNAASNNVKNLVEKAGGKIIITENQTNEK